MYSIVQYLDDPARREPRNIGVLLASGTKVHRDFIEREDVDHEVISRFRELLDYLIDEELAVLRERPELVVEELAQRRFSHFRFTEPLQMDELPDQPRAALDALLERLVKPPSQSHSLSL
jgi:hypothetical protein